MTAETWEPPRCRHGHVILGCPLGWCPDQNAYIDEQNAAMDRWERDRQDDARRLVRDYLGLP